MLAIILIFIVAAMTLAANGILNLAVGFSERGILRTLAGFFEIFLSALVVLAILSLGQV